MPKAHGHSHPDRTNQAGFEAGSDKIIANIRCRFVPTALDQDVKDFALGADGVPKVDHAANDLEIDFVEMLGRTQLWPFPEVRCYSRPEMDCPAPDRLVGDENPASAKKSSTSRKLSVKL